MCVRFCLQAFPQASSSLPTLPVASLTIFCLLLYLPRLPLLAPKYSHSVLEAPLPYIARPHTYNTHVDICNTVCVCAHRIFHGLFEPEILELYRTGEKKIKIEFTMFNDSKNYQFEFSQDSVIYVKQETQLRVAYKKPLAHVKKKYRLWVGYRLIHSVVQCYHQGTFPSAYSALASS